MVLVVEHDRAMKELGSLVQSERAKAEPTRHDSLKKITELYERLGCNAETHSERSTWDRCLNAKAFMRSLEVGAKQQQ